MGKKKKNRNGYNYDPRESVSLVREMLDPRYESDTRRYRGVLSSLVQEWGNANERSVIESRTQLKAAKIEDKMVEVRAGSALDLEQHTIWMRRETREQAREQTINMKRTNRLLSAKVKTEELNVKMIRDERKQRKQLAAAPPENPDEQ